MVAQARVLGGNFGIAASAAILALKEQIGLSGLIPASQLSSLDFASLDLVQFEAFQKAYLDAFKESLRVASLVSAIAFLFALGSFRKNPPTLEQRGKDQLSTEAKRTKATPNRRGNGD